MNQVASWVLVVLFSGVSLFAESAPAQEGKMYKGTFCSSNFMPGAVHPYVVYIPAQYNSAVPAAIYVSQDGMRGFEPKIFDGLIASNQMPVCIGLFVSPGKISPPLSGGADRSTRCPEYDSLGPDYADFIIKELLPEIAAKYNLKLSENPDLHAIGGNSSGGICAFNAAWERNDFFHRVYMSSPSLVAFRGGDILPVLVRKTEPKIIRAYMTAGTEDMRNSGGDWHFQALTMNEALKYSNYDFRFELFEGGRHGAGFDKPDVFERVQTFLWADWGIPLKVPKLPPRIADVFENGSSWERTDEKFPSAASTPFCISGNQILTTDGKPATDKAFGRISGIAISSDRWRLYIASESSRYIVAMSLATDGTLKNPYNIGWLNIPDDAQNCGAAGICVDRDDRIYVATALGVQLLDNSGHNQAILPMPDGAAVTAVRFGGENNKILYATTAAGNIFKRATKTGGLLPDSSPLPPGKIGL